MKQECRFFIQDPSSTGPVRRAANLMGLDLDFNEVRLGDLAIVVNELSTNILKHANRGEMILVKNFSGLSILAIDKGPGVNNLDKCLRDGYSTVGTAGNGLGAVKRLTSRFDLYSEKTKGTVVLACFDLETHPPSLFQCNGFSLPLRSEVVSGDNWVCQSNDLHNMFRIMVADGSGHGLEAHQASKAAVVKFKATKALDPLTAVTDIHLGLNGTVGAAISVAYYMPDKKEVSCCGLGNIAGSIVSHNEIKNLISYNGIAGVVLKKTQSFNYGMELNQILIMHSDGLNSNWDLALYQGLLYKDPLIIAGVLYRDFNRGNDDVTVIVAKESL